MLKELQGKLTVKLHVGDPSAFDAAVNCIENALKGIPNLKAEKPELDPTWRVTVLDDFPANARQPAVRETLEMSHNDIVRKKLNW